MTAFNTRIAQFILGLGLLGLALGCGKKSEESKPDAEAAKALGNPEFTVEADELAKELKKDKAAGETKFKGKVVEVSGTVVFIKYGNKQGLVALQASGSDVVGCRFADRNIAAKIAPRQPVRIKGRYAEYAGGPVLEDCEIVDGGPDMMLPITAEDLAKEYTTDHKALDERIGKKTLVITGEIAADKSSKKENLLELKGDGTTVIEIALPLAFSWPDSYKPGAKVRFAASPLRTGTGRYTVAFETQLDPE